MAREEMKEEKGDLKFSVGGYFRRGDELFPAFAVFLAVTLLCAALLTARWSDERLGAEEYERLSQWAGLERSGEEAGRAGSSVFGEMDPPDPEVQVNEAKLQKLNPDFAAWLWIPGIDVSYPVTAPETNEQYLRRTFAGEQRACGTLFFDCAADPAASLNAVIHGHNMRSGEMFGRLKDYLETEKMEAEKMEEEEIRGADGREMEKEPVLFLWMDGRWESYRLLTAYTADHLDVEPYRFLFSSEEEFKEYVKNCEKRDMRKMPAGAGETEKAGKKEKKEKEEKKSIGKILTLSTCHGKNMRLIVQWGLVE